MTIESHTCVQQADCSAIDLLASTSALSRQKIREAMDKGAIWLSHGKYTQRLRRHRRSLKIGDILHLYYDRKILDVAPPEPQLIADEGSYSVWNKPSGLRTEGSKWSDHCTITRWSEKHLQPQRNAFLVHRLDRAANGLILIAHSKKAAAELSTLFRTRQITKQYSAVVSGRYDGATRLDCPLDKREAITHIEKITFDDSNKTSQLQIRIETGRKHQIRRHLSDAGYPIVGDRLYGEADQDTDLRLCATSLSFQSPFDEMTKTYNSHGVKAK